MYNIHNYDDDLFFTCSTIEYIARATNNKRIDIVNYLGITGLYQLYDLACVNHCLTPEQLIGENIEDYNIVNGNFDNVGTCNVNLPGPYGIGSLYMSLILNTLDVPVMEPGEPRENVEYKKKVLMQLIKIYNSWICDYIDNYNNLVFTGSPQFHYECYKAGEILD